jgi:hypothetical protein
MDELGVEIAELREATKLLLRRRDLPIVNKLDFLGRNGNLPSYHSVVQVLHLMKSEEACLQTQLQALLLKTLKHKTHVLGVLLHNAIVGTCVIEEKCTELV